MNDIPIFVTETGTASLILREIPYKKLAYIVPRSVLPGGMRPMLNECAAFCVQAGAERILAEGADGLPHVHDMLELTCERQALPALEEAAQLEEVRAETFELYQKISNRLFEKIPNSATCRSGDMERILTQKSAFFAILHGRRAGVAETGENELRSIGVLPEFRGLGYRFALTLLQNMDGPELRLRVSSSNERALALYNRLGFTVRRVLSRWYLVREG